MWKTLFVFFFFLMIRRPPRSTLFPTRRSSDLLLGNDLDHAVRRVCPVERRRGGALDHFDALDVVGIEEIESRSEEHTSELQSQSNLVCRLLLEKKTHAFNRSAARSYSDDLQRS